MFGSSPFQSKFLFLLQQKKSINGQPMELIAISKTNKLNSYGDVEFGRFVIKRFDQLEQE